MQTYSTLQAAKKLGITDVALGRYVKVGKIPAPQTVRVGIRNIRVWTDADIEHVRNLLPKIANGRKTRYEKLKKGKAPARVPVPQSQETQPRAPHPQHAKTARAGGPGAALPKTRKTKKKK